MKLCNCQICIGSNVKEYWITDVGASNHMYNERFIFKKFLQLQSEDTVSLGDSSVLDVKGEGTMHMEMILQDGTKKKCT